MNSATLDHKCPNCSATLKFNPHGQNWVCEYCRSEFTKEEIEASEAKRGHIIDENTEAVATEKDANGMDIYSCPNCGAQIVADENTTATFCVYCKSTAILKNKLVGEFNPSKVIPFYKTKEDAIEAFKKIGKGKPFMPKEFSSQKNIDEMKGVYIPFWLYDFSVNGSIEADAKRVKTWRSGDYQYTKTDTYLVFRDGNMTYHKIPVDGSTHFEDDVMNSIEPFDYTGLVDFSHSYLSGFLAEKYDVESDKAISAAQERAKNSTTNTLKSSIGGYTSIHVVKENHQLEKTNEDYVLLPVWMLNIKYHDKCYIFAMNGQTGKMIGDIPVDKKKVAIWWIGLFVITFAICSLIWILGGIL
jgi:DNA-directed RNA polymerase subunit RPC12/RpoP